MAATDSGGILGNLSVQGGPLAGQQFPVTQPSVTIGRTAGNDIVINDPEVSRRHARLTWDGQQFIIEDLGSTNGTFINGVQITAPQPVSSGAALRLGALDVSFQSSLVAGGVDPITNVNMPAPQPPAPVAGSPISAPVPPPVRGSTPWLLILGGGAVLVLALIAVVVAAAVFLSPGSSAPTTTITAPLDGSEVTVAGEVPVIAIVNDEGGVMRVELWVNGGLQDTVDSAGPPGQTGFPVQFQWTPSHEGSHMLEVRPYSRNGQSGEPASVVVHAVPGDDTAVVLVEPTPTGQGGFLFLLDTPDPGPASGTAGCTSDAAFVSDVTIPHYTEIPAGQSFDKIWRIRNSGTCPWDAGYQLAYASGDLMNAPPSQAVSATSPGGTADVQVTMYAPDAPGTYKGIWQMQDAGGQAFGTSLTVVIVVQGDDAPPPDAPLPDVPPPPDAPDSPDSSGCVAAVDFRADDTVIDRGETTTLRWDVECVREVYFQGSPVTGHENRDVAPETTTIYVLRVVKNDGSSEERLARVEVRDGGSADSGGEEDEADSSSPTLDVEVAFHSYDPGTGQVIFRIHNGSVSPTLEGIDAQIVNYSSGESYYSGYSGGPFASSLEPVPFDLRLEAGGLAYLKYDLRGAPSEVRCRATFDLYTGEGRTGDRVRKVVDFTPQGSTSSALKVSIDLIRYDPGTGQVIFRIINAPDSSALESVNTRIVNQSSGESYYGGYSDAPFASNLGPVPFDSRLAPDRLAYLKYVLRGAPTEVRCRATIDVYTGESRTGDRVTKVVDFTPSGGDSIGARLSYHSYDASSGWLTFLIVNNGGVTIEGVEGQVRDPGAGTNLYGPGYSPSPFRDSPTSNTLVDSLAPGATKYLRYRLTGATSGTATAATIKLYASNDRSGASTTRTFGFTLP